jgi:hypothetical protein
VKKKLTVGKYQLYYSQMKQYSGATSIKTGFYCLLSLFSNVISQNSQNVDISKYGIRVICNGMMLVANTVTTAQEDQKILVNGTQT